MLAVVKPIPGLVMAALAIAGVPLSPVRLSSISRPNYPRAGSKRDSASMRAKTSRQTRTFSR